MNVKINKIRLLLSSFLVLTATAQAGVPVDVKLKTVANVDINNIHFSDVLDEKNTDPQFLKKFGPYVFTVDATSGYIQPSDILTSLVRYGADLNEIHLLSTDPIKISKIASSGIMDDIRFKLTKKLQEKGFKINPAKKMIVADVESLPAVGQYESINLDISQFDASKAETQVLAEFVTKTGQTIYSSIVNIKIISEFKALVSNKNFLPGAIAKPGDFEEKTVSEEPRNPFLMSDGQSQWQVLNPLQQGQVVSAADLTVSTKMSKGDTITLLTGDKRFQVRALGRVKEILDSGSSVVVENLESKKELIGKPVSSTEVQIVY